MQALSRNSLNAASDALSRREQDLPVDANDERLRHRELQLLKENVMISQPMQPVPLTLVRCSA